MNKNLAPLSTTEPDVSAPGSTISASIRLWQAVAAAHAALAEELELHIGGASCPVLAADSIAVLLSLADEPAHQLRMHELAERAHLTPSGLTRRVDRLVSKGLLARVGCPGDRRGAFARLTPRGLDELRRALPHHAAILERYVVPRIDEAGIHQLISVLTDVARRSPGVPVPTMAGLARATAKLSPAPAFGRPAPAPARARQLSDPLEPAITLRGR